MNWRLAYSTKARHDLKKLPLPQARAIYRWIGRNLENCENPRAVEGYKPLSGIKNAARYRVGKYRILVSMKDATLTVTVIRVAHRKDAYRNIPKNT